VISLVSRALGWLRAVVTVARDLLSRKRQVLHRRDLMVAELRHNAQVLDEWGGRFGLWKDFRGRLSLLRWEEFGEDMGMFEKRTPGLWPDLVDAYSQLQLATGARSPKLRAASLYELATRLAEAPL
jgi:hypothetical protein